MYILLPQRHKKSSCDALRKCSVLHQPAKQQLHLGLQGARLWQWPCQLTPLQPGIPFFLVMYRHFSPSLVIIRDELIVSRNYRMPIYRDFQNIEEYIVSNPEMPAGADNPAFVQISALFQFYITDIVQTLHHLPKVSIWSKEGLTSTVASVWGWGHAL